MSGADRLPGVVLDAFAACAAELAACVALGVKNRSTVLGLIESGVPCAAAFALVD
jgi:hypothetical protein